MFQITNREETFTLLKTNPITIKGFSRSAYRTGYFIKPYNIYLDAGLPYCVPANLILVSHGHNDHIASLYSILKEGRSPVVALPKKIIDDVQHMLNSTYNLDTNSNTLFNGWKPTGDESFPIKLNGTNFRIDCYNLDHRVPCKAYGITEFKRKLKNMYQELSGKEISLLKQKVDIYDLEENGILLFVSDTGKSALKSLPFDKYQIVIIECTFLDECHYNESIKRKHLHWFDLEPILKNYPHIQFIFGHFSSRYKNDFIQEFYSEKKSIYSNVIFWI